MPGDISNPAAGPLAAGFRMDGPGCPDQGADRAHRAIGGHLSLLRVAWRLAPLGLAVFDPLGWLILALIVLPWYVAALSIHGQLFIDGFFLKHNVQRFAGTLEGHGGSALYYLIAVPLLLLPWSGPFFAALRNVRDDSRTSVRRFLWIWSGFVVLFFSLSGTACRTMCCMASRRCSSSSRPIATRCAGHGCILRRQAYCWPCFPPCRGSSALSNSTAGDAYYRAQLGRALELADARYYIGTLAALLIWIVVMLRWRQALWKRLVVAAALQVTVLAALVVPYAGALVQGPVRDMAIKLREMDEAVTLKSFTAPSFSVHRQAVTQREEPAPGGLAVTRIDRIPQTGYDTLAIEGGVALVRRHTE